MDNYEERYVAFIDILGFKDLVSKSEVDAGLLNKLVSVLDDMKIYDGGLKWFETKDIAYTDLCRMSTFSDSILISAKANDFGLLAITVMTGLISSVLLLQGIYTRGAISKGKLIHTDNIVLGNGLIRAYELESKTAIFPRIIIDENVMSSYRAEIKIPDFMDCMRLDFDGLWHLHVLHSFFLVPAMKRQSVQSDELFSVLDSVIGEIENTIKTTHSLGVKSKIYWLSTYFNESAASLGVRKIELEEFVGLV